MGSNDTGVSNVLVGTVDKLTKSLLERLMKVIEFQESHINI